MLGSGTEWLTGPYVAMSVPQHFVQQVAELPANDGVAGQRQVEDVRPHGGRPALLVTAKKDVFNCCQGKL